MKKCLIYICLLGGMLCFAGCGAESESSEDRDVIVAGDYYIAAIDANGEVHIAYQTDREYDDISDTFGGRVDKWMKNAGFPVGISEEGDLILPKGQSYEELVLEEQRVQEELPLGAVYGEGHVADLYAAEKMQDWKELQMVTGDYPGCTLGVLKDGSLCEAGITERVGSLDEVLSWSNIVDAAVLYSGESIIGLDGEGNVHTRGFEDVEWTDVVEIEAGNTIVFGLKQDGSVVHTEDYFGKDYSTEGMKDIVFIAVGYDAEASRDVVYGIRKDGKVVDRLGQEVPGFADMVEIDVTMAEGIIVGRNAEGKLVVSQEADENFKKLVEKYNQK